MENKTWIKNVLMPTEEYLAKIPDYKIGCVDIFHDQSEPIPEGWIEVPFSWLDKNEYNEQYLFFKNYPFFRENTKCFWIDDKSLQEYCAGEKISDKFYTPLNAFKEDGFIVIIKMK